MPDMPSIFDRAIPVLASPDIAASLDFFRRLGFETQDFGAGGYGIALREHVEIHFWLCADRHVAEHTSCYVRVNDIRGRRGARYRVAANAPLRSVRSSVPAAPWWRLPVNRPLSSPASPAVLRKLLPVAVMA